MLLPRWRRLLLLLRRVVPRCLAKTESLPVLRAPPAPGARARIGGRRVRRPNSGQALAPKQAAPRGWAGPLGLGCHPARKKGGPKWTALGGISPGLPRPTTKLQPVYKKVCAAPAAAQKTRQKKSSGPQPRAAAGRTVGPPPPPAAPHPPRPHARHRKARGPPGSTGAAAFKTQAPFASPPTSIAAAAARASSSFVA
jgi:hypothetical protein